MKLVDAFKSRDTVHVIAIVFFVSALTMMGLIIAEMVRNPHGTKSHDTWSITNSTSLASMNLHESLICDDDAVNTTRFSVSEYTYPAYVVAHGGQSQPGNPFPPATCTWWSVDVYDSLTLLVRYRFAGCITRPANCLLGTRWTGWTGDTELVAATFEWAGDEVHLHPGVFSPSMIAVFVLLGIIVLDAVLIVIRAGCVRGMSFMEEESLNWCCTDRGGGAHIDAVEEDEKTADLSASLII